MSIIHTTNYEAEILVICDPPKEEEINSGLPMRRDYISHFAKQANLHDIKKDDFAFVSCGPRIPVELEYSKTKSSKYLKEYIPEFRDVIARYCKVKLIITLGAWAAHQFAGKQVKITEIRGQALTYSSCDIPVFHMYHIGYVLAHPSNQRQFEADFVRLASLKKSNYNLQSVALDTDLDYQWCTDLTEWIEDPPVAMAFDTEGTGLDWFKPEVYPFTLQLCRKEGSAICIPIDRNYYPELERDHDLIISQVKQLMGNDKIRKAGHNIKYDYHMLKNSQENIICTGPFIDTQQLIFAVDENIKNKRLAEGVRLFVPEMAGYDDEFSRTIDKEKMIEVEPQRLMTYGCSDSDAVYRLAKILMRMLKKDPRQYFLFNHVQMPAIMAFADTLENYGVPIDEEELRNLGQMLDVEEKGLYNKLICEVPGPIKRWHLEDPKHAKKKPEDVLSFSRAAFTRDILFTPQGFNLKPKVFTKGTKMLKDSEKVPSTSGKMHLIYFKDYQTKSGYKFIDNLMEYQKLQKMQGTYVGEEGDDEGDGITGFWKYMHNGIIRPSYFLSVTVTGRSSSRNPNGQNIPVRGEYAKAFKKLFKAPTGWKFIKGDYSQAELRIAAIMAQEPTMLQAYMDGKDLHAVTAANGMRLTYDQFMQLEEKTIELNRYHAKSENFGLIYGLLAKGYRDYAYTNFQLSLTLEESEAKRTQFFDTYRELPKWHKKSIALAHRDGFIRALHGAKRSLPDIRSVDIWTVREAERMAINAPVQRFASDLGVIALTRLVHDMKRSIIQAPIQPRMFIHDALVFMVPDEYVETALPIIKWYMESNPIMKWFGLTLPIPMTCDLEVGLNLAEMQKRKDVIAIRPEWASDDELLIA